MWKVEESALNVDCIELGIYSDDEVGRLSVKLIHSEYTVDDLGHPVEGGIFDGMLGPMNLLDSCVNCKLPYHDCPGHCGHISLTIPVFNPLTFPILFKLLNNKCVHCHRLRHSVNYIKSVKKVFEAKDEILDISETRKIAQKILLKTSLPSCSHCNMLSPRLRHERQSKIIQMDLSSKMKDKNNQLGGLDGCVFSDDEEDSTSHIEVRETNESKRVILTIEAEKLMNLLWNSPDGELLQDIFGGFLGYDNDLKNAYKAFFINNLIVPPIKYRPAAPPGSTMGDHPLNSVLLCILNSNNEIPKYWNNTTPETTPLFHQLVVELQNSVNCLFDRNLNVSRKNKTILDAFSGIRQLLDKKEGLFRRNMMGKRVNFAARSVIAPDPYISTDEIGIPERFAKVLTFKCMVTNFNVQDMRQRVINGPFLFPGANLIEIQGRVVDLSRKSIEERQGIAAMLLSTCDTVTVHRHLQDGDALLANRQPTLHKPGIMAHKARVLGGEQTIRFHYANCNTYNADFDGDEINLHFPQDHIARAEALLIASTPQQYLVPKDGTPLRGLIQDHVVSGVLLTLKDTFLTKDEYTQMLYVACRDLCGSRRIVMVDPALQYPGRLWTGKQVLSGLLMNLTAGKHKMTMKNGKCKIPKGCWGEHILESTVRIQNNELIHGVLDKAQIGASSYGFVHCVYELYGPDASEALLTALARLFTHFLQSRKGFTCGMDDLLLHHVSDEMRSNSINTADFKSKQSSSEFVQDLLPDVKKGPLHSDQMIEEALKRKIAVDNQQEVSKALDSKVKSNLNQLTSEIIKKALNPSSKEGLYKMFPVNNLALMTMSGAKGSNVNLSQISCLLGQQELEGRRVPRTSIGRTLPCFKPYDSSARAGGFITDRFLTGVRPQEYYFHCMAGREGLVDTAVKTSRSGYLQRCLIKHLENLKVHYDYTVRDGGNDNQVVQFLYGEDSIDSMKTAFLYNEQYFGFLKDNYHALLDKLDPRGALEVLEVEKASEIWSKEETYSAGSVLETLNPGSHLGAVSDKFQSLLNSLQDDDDGKFQVMMWLKYVQSLIQPGEAVGLLAAQSIGEPSTQMTLNTFHLAGFGGANVTLGIPRLREIIMTASKSISTPLMQVYLSENGHDKDHVNQLGNVLKRINVGNVTCGIVMKESIDQKTRMKNIHISIELDNKTMDSFGISLSQLASIVKLKLLHLLVKHSVEEIVSKSSTDEVDVDDRVGNDQDSIEEKDVDSDKEEEEVESKDYSEDEEDTIMHTGKNVIKMDVVDSRVPNQRNLQVNLLEVDDDYIRIGFNVNLDTGRCLLDAGRVQKCLDLCIIQDIKGISSCYITQPGVNSGALSNEEYAVQTEGINFYKIWNLAQDWGIDINRLYSNDIHAIYSTYGVEAARASIVREISSVFAVYGISVDPRHLFLLADYMTAMGGFKPLSRIGIENSTSPFLKMTFETSSKFLSHAVLHGEKDHLETVSSQLVAGKLIQVGTGAFDLVQPLKL